MNVDDTFHGISTLLLTGFQGRQIQGTGFFYDELAPEDPNTKGFYWREVEATWIVTNRHVLLPKVEGNEIIPDTVIFHVRKVVGQGIVWEPVILDVTEIKKRLKLHTDSEVDVAILRVDDLLRERMKPGKVYMTSSSVSEEDLPENKNISAEVADDVVIIGYPKGFYDEKNIFPIVKSGIIATRWGMNFNDMPVFLIDAKLFPGSSGSIVVTKPISSIVAEGPMKGERETQFAFLGVYSGEPFRQQEPIDLDDITIIRKDSFNVGTVWYGKLVVDIVKKGKALS